MESDPLGVANVDFDARYVVAGPGVRLRLLTWRPRSASGCPLVFIPGWVSALDGWLDLLRALVPEHAVYYLETREKGSARLEAPRTEDFYVPAQARELSFALAAVDRDVSRAVFFGSSLGASIILEALKHQRLKTRAAFLVGPTCHFAFPWWGHLLVRMPASSYALAKHVVLWYLRTFRVDAKAEPEQMRRYQQTLESAQPQRMKMSARALAGFSVWHDLETVETPVGVAYATTDTLHGSAAIKRLVSTLPRAVAVPCPSNKYMHTAALKADIDTFLATLV